MPLEKTKCVTPCEGHTIACPKNNSDGWCYMRLESACNHIGEQVVIEIAKIMRDSKKDMVCIDRRDMVGKVVDDVIMLQLSHDNGDIQAEDVSSFSIISKAITLIKRDYKP